MKIKFTVKEIEEFVHNHIQEEVNLSTLTKKGFSYIDGNFENEFNLYKLGLTEGIINGIHMMGGDVVDLEYRDNLD